MHVVLYMSVSVLLRLKDIRQGDVVQILKLKSHTKKTKIACTWFMENQQYSFKTLYEFHKTESIIQETKNTNIFISSRYLYELLLQTKMYKTIFVGTCKLICNYNVQYPVHFLSTSVNWFLN